MDKAIVVIGANYGDEGKGLMTDYFSMRERLSGRKCLNVLSNGGSQRGHTVDLGNGIRHVFRHFGSGTFSGAHTYIPSNFIVNPMNFVREYKEVTSILGYEPTVYVEPQCKVTTPYDMMANQIIENARGDQRHGSCGVGIWETINNPYAPKKSDLFTDGKLDFVNSVEKTISIIKEYYLDVRFFKKGIDIPNDWVRIWSNDNIIRHYIEDCRFFARHVMFGNICVFDNYDTMIFENGQGLMLDEERFAGTKQEKYTTPSYTGLKIPAQIIGAKNKDAKVEVCYVSRTYLTRHGNGAFETEDLQNRIVDETNAFNIWQGEFRTGVLDYKEMFKRTLDDFVRYRLNSRNGLSYAFTHCDEVKIPDNVFSDVPKELLHIYRSYGSTRRQVTE